MAHVDSRSGQTSNEPQPRGQGRTFPITILAFILLCAISPQLISQLVKLGPQGPGPRTRCTNQLRNITLALRSYEAEWGTLPPAYTVDPQGRRLHSWRTLILPQLDHAGLYNRIDLSKPWNDPANIAAAAGFDDAYCCPEVDCPSGHTTYQAFVGEEFCLHPTRPRKLSEITDSHTETMIVAEVNSANSVHWMSPHDNVAEFILSMNKQTQLPHSGLLNVMFVDGRSDSLAAELSQTARRALITISGGD